VLFAPGETVLYRAVVRLDLEAVFLLLNVGANAMLSASPNKMPLRYIENKLVVQSAELATELATEVDEVNIDRIDITISKLNWCAKRIALSMPTSVEKMELPARTQYQTRYNEWQSKWDAVKVSDVQSINMQRTLALLADYVGHTDTKIPNNVIRFFKGHPKRHYTVEVESSIQPYLQSTAVLDLVDTLNVRTILRTIKEKIGDQVINPIGDLRVIFDLIKHNTGVDYTILEALTKPTSTAPSIL
jgi:hypothetical protein